MKINLIALVIIFTVIISLNVSGFAVTSYYSPELPLILNPGETTIVQAFGLQNMVGGEDIVMKAEQTSGFEVAEIVGGDLEYEVPLGRKDVFANVKVTVPEDAEIGQEYNIGVVFTKINERGKEGSVKFSESISLNMIVVVGERIEKDDLEKVPETATPEEEMPIGVIGEKSNINFSTIILIAVIFLLIIFYVYEYKKKSKVKKRVKKR